MEKYKPEQAEILKDEVKKLSINVETLKNAIAVVENAGLEAFKKIFKN